MSRSLFVAAICIEERKNTLFNVIYSPYCSRREYCSCVSVHPNCFSIDSGQIFSDNSLEEPLWSKSPQITSYRPLSSFSNMQQKSTYHQMLSSILRAIINIILLLNSEMNVEQSRLMLRNIEDNERNDRQQQIVSFVTSESSSTDTRMTFEKESFSV